MRLEWLKRQLLQKSAGRVTDSRVSQRHRRGPSSTSSGNATGPSMPRTISRKQSAYVIAEKMESAGCSCLLVGRRRQQSLSSSSAQQRSRVVLPGVSPGTVLRTRASVLEWILQFRQLPSCNEYTVLMMGGRPVSRHAGDAGVPALPCGMAATNACRRCPWMAVGASGASSSAKQACWRASLESAVREMSASYTPMSDAVDRDQVYDGAMRCCSFSEPFTVAVTPNRLSGLQLFFSRVSSSENPTLTPCGQVDSSMLSSDISCATRVVVCIEREGLSRPPSLPTHVGHGESTDSAELPEIPTNSSSTGLSCARECLLETLEQKRLVPTLEHWAAQLPTSTQASLLGVFISQPYTSGPRLATRTSLQVVLTVERNRDVLGVHSPLCSPSHPADLLSTEEQQLVEVVTAAAPLIHEVEVLVWILDASTEVRGATAEQTALHRLHPVVCRGCSLEEVQCEKWRSSTKSVRYEMKAGKVQRQRVSQMVRCWCHPLNKEISVSVPPYHAAISAVPSQWWREACHRESLSRRNTRNTTLLSPVLPLCAAAGNVAPRFADEIPRRLPWIPTFWRHAGALDACSSMLLSLILENMSLATGETSAIAEGGARHRRASVEVYAPPLSARLSLVVAGADVGAWAGQSILDCAVVELARELRRIDTSTNESERAAHSRSSDVLFSSTSSTPRRVLVSVRGADNAVKALTTAYVEEILLSVRTQPVRLCFYECTLTMSTAALATQVALTLHYAQGNRLSVSVDTGIVNVDPLASSYMAYACVSLSV